MHSLGPFGANILDRVANFGAEASPAQTPAERARDRSPFVQKAPATRRELSPAADNIIHNDDLAHKIVNHVINQLAFSRLSSTPLSTILHNLPSELRSLGAEAESLTTAQLKALIDGASCVGEVPRAGKDAAGKALESEYYYVPEEDTDEGRRDAVVEGLRKPGLRSCRKQHKV